MAHFLVAESETADERATRRDRAGKSSGESYAATLEQMVPGCAVSRVAPADADATLFSPDDLAGFDAVFVTGSPLHVYDDTPEVARQLGFMRAVFRSGTPSFGSCAGLQLAVAAAGGTVRKMPRRIEAGIARRIIATPEGRDHPLLAGRPCCWDAPAIHGDEVEALPEGALLLAGNGVTRVQAAEIRHDGGVFWGVQYHPELAPGEIAVALERQADDLVESGLADDRAQVLERAALLTQIHRTPDRLAPRWLLGVDDQFTDENCRRTELRNFIAHVAALRGG
ncbi:type 1 glutamine amidotransferase [Sphingomonas sp. VNH70]|uniref:type 1 glutamine amidotransferase n=1 Tax=Sphingomonas silueang TaxID=3156617 RepID=UPI0032B3127A